MKRYVRPLAAVLSTAIAAVAIGACGSSSKSSSSGSSGGGGVRHDTVVESGSRAAR